MSDGDRCVWTGPIVEGGWCDLQGFAGGTELALGFIGSGRGDLALLVDGGDL